MAFRHLMAALVVAILVGASLAQPFVWPDAWGTDASSARAGGTVTTWTLGDPSSLNPFHDLDVNAILALADLRGARLLLRVPGSTAFLPYSARSWSRSPDGTRLAFTLRQGMRWSDGTPITVDDYAFRYLAELDPAVQSARREEWLIDGVPISLERLSANTLVFTLPRPDRLALGQIASLVPAPEHILGPIYRQGGGDALRRAWGPGTDPAATVWSAAWQPVHVVRGELIAFEPNPYFGEWNVDERGRQLPRLDRLNISVLDDPRPMAALFLSGQLDVFGAPVAEPLPAVRSAIAAGDVAATLEEAANPGEELTAIVPNLNHADTPWKQRLLADVRFRRALSHLLDREAIIELAYGSNAAPRWSQVPSAYADWRVDNLARFPYRPAAAQTLLDALGFGRVGADGIRRDAAGHRLSLDLVVPAERPERLQMAQILRDSAAEVGLDLRILPLSLSLVVDLLSTRGPDRPFDLIIIGYLGTDPVWPFPPGFTECDGTLHNFNGAGTCLTRAEARLQQLQRLGRAALDGAAAQAIGADIQRLEASQLFVIPTVETTWSVAWNDRLGGLLPRELREPGPQVFLPELVYVRPP